MPTVTFRKATRFTLACAALCFAARPAAAAGGGSVTADAHHDVSAPFSAMAGQAVQNAGDTMQQALVARATGATFNSSQSDPVSQPLTTGLATVQPGLNFQAQNANDTLAAIGTKYVPPDTNGAVGATQYVQMVNVTIAVYSKKTGDRVLGPAAIHTLWTRIRRSV